MEKLQSLRGQLDAVDDRIAQLFVQRMELVRQVAQAKAEGNMAVAHRAREREILSRVTQNMQPPMDGYTRAVFSTLFDVSRSYQARLLQKETPLRRQIEQARANTPALFPQKGTVACQGVDGAYSQIACDKLFPMANILYFKNFEGVFSAVEKGLCQYGILPIENSTYGTVDAVYDLMRHYHFHIVRSIKLKINHSLLARPGVRMQDVKEIFSHEQAIGQCSAFLKSLSGVKVTVCENTAMAAEMVAKSARNDAAAISSRDCAALYGLSVLSDEVQNNDSNSTRFICITKDLQIYPGANRISLMLTLPHNPGSLYQMISKFSVLGVNLTKLESRPIAGKDFEFLFYFDLEASVCAPEVVSLLCELSGGPEQFVFLGNYMEV